MQSIRDNFEELRHRLGHGRTLDSTGTEPIYYLVFPVADILEVKRQTKAWFSKLGNDGWNVVTLSAVDAIDSVLQKHKMRKLWLTSEHQLLDLAERNHAPIDFREINKTLSKALTEGPELQQYIETHLQVAESHPHGLLLITDLEALHPYLRINTIEAKLQGRVRCPVVVLYPGKREGKTSLRFLEFYPADPNYRSEHIG